MIPLSLVIMLFAACRKDEPIDVEDFQGVIFSIQPDAGKRGDAVSISGIGFGSDLSILKAYVNGKRATIIFANDTIVRIVVPPRAGTGPVSVAGLSGGASGPIFHFTYTASVSTYAGIPGTPGMVDGAGLQSKFNFPAGIVSDSLGNLMVADRMNHVIRRISPGGSVVTLAGTGSPGHLDGSANTAQFNQPTGVTFNPFTKEVYVADRNNHCIRKVTSNGIVSTVAGIPGIVGFVDGPGLSCRLNEPAAVAFEPNFSNLYIAEVGNHCIRKLSQFQVVSTFAGSAVSGNADGVGASASFNTPYALALDSTLNLMVSDSANHNIRRVRLMDATVTTLTGTGIAGFANGLSPTYNAPTGMAWLQGKLLVADANNHAIRLVFPDGSAELLAGNGVPGFQDGIGNIAKFNIPFSIVSGLLEGEFFVTDSGNHCIRRLMVE
ncbi:MAG: IPT/TIG domain-containing protein [Bacteroidota bacterium]